MPDHERLASASDATIVRFAGSIDEYLHWHFCDEAALAAVSGIGIATLRELIVDGLAPQPAYVVEHGSIRSYAFGTMPAADAPRGAWFSPANAAWVKRALEAVAVHGRERAPAALEARFKRDYAAALRHAHAADGPLPGYARADGDFDDDAYDTGFAEVWRHFLAGTFSLCVRDAHDETRIAEKESLQSHLAAATDNGAKPAYTAAESAVVLALINRYLAASMPFSPIEYPRSSRRRLVEDVLPRLEMTP